MLTICEKVYKTYSVWFHCNLANSESMTSVAQIRRVWNDQFDSSTQSAILRLSSAYPGPPSVTNYQYAQVSSVEVRLKYQSNPLSFWLGKVLEVYSVASGVFHKLFVHWYEYYNATDRYTGKFCSLFPNRGCGWDPLIETWCCLNRWLQQRHYPPSSHVIFANGTYDRQVKYYPILLVIPIIWSNKSLNPKYFNKNLFLLYPN